LKELYLTIKEIVTELQTLLEAEELSGSHPLWKEIKEFHNCLEILLRFKDPQCSVLPKKITSGSVIDSLISMISALPPLMRPFLIQQLLNDPKMPLEVKFYLLLYLGNDEKNKRGHKGE